MIEAKYGVDCGAIEGQHIVPEYIEISEPINDESNGGYYAALRHAQEIARRYPANPQTHLTKVSLLSLHGPQGRIQFNSKPIVERHEENRLEISL